MQGLGVIIYYLATGLQMKRIDEGSLIESQCDYTTELEDFINQAMSESTDIDDLMKHRFLSKPVSE